jgi:hypothetical protein
MPESALATVPVHCCVPAAALGGLVVRLVRGERPPAASAAAQAEALRHGERSRHPAVQELRGLKVLVVEDSYLIATDVRRMLLELGCETIGPAPDLVAGLRLLDHGAGPPGAAVLDVHLHGEAVFPLAAALRRAGVPLVFATGYGTATFSGAWSDAVRLQKPFGRRQLEDALRMALAARGERDALPFSLPTAERPADPLRTRLEETVRESRNIVMESRALHGRR